jgi:hypothetical protein
MWQDASDAARRELQQAYLAADSMLEARA